MEYILNDPKYGMKYDFKKIMKEFKKLKIPEKVFNPCHLPLERAKYFNLLSERTIGKTSNILLLGMVFNKIYGTHICYVRQSEEMIAPKVTNDLFAVIENDEFGYIDKLTNGEWTHICYKNRRWYYCKYNEKNEIVMNNEHFMVMLSIDNNFTYKSGFNEPKGDFIIFDEFIGKYYRPNEFVDFTDLFMTIARKRLSPLIFMLSNVIDLYSPYFDELMIENEVQEMIPGDSQIITTPDGTNIYVELIGGEEYVTPEKKLFNKLFLGFKNPKLNAMTGQGWAIANYPHPPKNGERIDDSFAIEFHGMPVGVSVFKNEKIGFYIVCHKINNIDLKDIIFVDRMIENNKEIYTMEKSKIGKKIIEMYRGRKFYYVTNNIGNLVTNFFNSKGVFVE